MGAALLDRTVTPQPGDGARHALACGRQLRRQILLSSWKLELEPVARWAAPLGILQPSVTPYRSFEVPGDMNENP